MAGRHTAYQEYNMEKLIRKGADYLLKNFHKFSDAQKINISLELVKKAMPSQVKMEGDMNITVELADRIREARERVTASIN